MSKADIRGEALRLLRKQYGVNNVVSEPTLKGEQTVYPDIAVYRNADHTEPFLLVECSSLRTSHRINRDLEEISDAVTLTGAPYGALLAPDVEFVFSGSGPAYRTYSEFPAIDEDEPNAKRAIQSRTELDFLVDRTLSAQESVRRTRGHEAQAADELLETLHLLLEARREGIVDDDFPTENSVNRLYDSIEARHDWYQEGDSINPELLAVPAMIFSGFDFAATEDQVLESLFEVTSDDRRGGDFSTPLEVARQMVRLLRPESDDKILDPAAGRGTVLSLATAEGSHGIGVEINSGVLRLATFYVDLFDRDVEHFQGNFFEMNSGSEPLLRDFDQVVVDPPFNMHIEDADIPYADDVGHLRSEEAFLAKGLFLLKEGGSITLIVPANFLKDRKREWVRTLVLEEFQLDSVIQILDGPIYRNTSIDTALITVSKQTSDPDHEVRYTALDSPKNPISELADAVSAINERKTDSVPQSSIDDSWDLVGISRQRSLVTELKSKYNETTSLSNVAEVQQGNRPMDLVESPEGDKLTYFSVSDLSDGPSRHEDRYISRNKTKVIADESCVLLSTIGKHSYIHIPSEPIAPAQDLAVIQFGSPDEALIYETFLTSDLAQEFIQTLKTGAQFSRVDPQDLRNLKVPKFSDDEVEERAKAIREHQSKLQNLDKQKEELANRTLDLLSEGDDDE